MSFNIWYFCQSIEAVMAGIIIGYLVWTAWEKVERRYVHHR
jgi:hypothetical protein